MTRALRDAGVIGHKLRVRPTDFIVEERIRLVPGGHGRYRLYRLTKEGWNTTDALAFVARRFGLPRGVLAFGGRKDRHAHTVQYVSAGVPGDLTVVEPGFRFEPAGFVDEPMGPAAIRVNAFRITLRALRGNRVADLARNAQALSHRGLPNYFDDQRFGSFDGRRGFIGKMLVLGQWEEALKTFFTIARPSDSAAVRGRKTALLERWWRWEECLAHAATPSERHVLGFLARRGADYLAALNLLPRDDLSMALSAYQSHLWNLLVARLLASVCPNLATLPGRVAPYRVPLALSAETSAWLLPLTLPTPSARAVMPEPRTAALYEALLVEEGITPRGLRLRDLRSAYLKSTPRAVMLRPGEFELGGVQPDELFPGRVRVTVAFTLPRGAYATMVVRRLVLASPEGGSASEGNSSRGRT
jgi:tRNA pseudouridine13 synthase